MRAVGLGAPLHQGQVCALSGPGHREAAALAFLFFAIVALAVGTPQVAAAQVAGPDSITPQYNGSAVVPEMAPVSSEFATYMLKRLSPLGSMLEEDYVPPPVDASVPEAGPALDADPAPSAYDLRTTGKLTPVRNQGGYGTCWAFAAMGSLESAHRPGETTDFSEDHMALASGFFSAASTPDTLYNTGGNYDMATAYLVRWSGPVHENDQPYGTGRVIAGLGARGHVQNVHKVPASTGPSDTEAIKTAVMRYGAVGVSMYWISSAYKTSTRSYYLSTTGGSNHAVDIVGWNDDYPAGNFAVPPPGNGAWLVRNSWGTSFGEAGYFYISYYDGRVARGTNVAIQPAESAVNYSRVLQYDTLGRTNTYGYGSPTAWFMNKFPVESVGMLRAVAFYANSVGSSYELYAGTTGTLSKVATGSLEYGGYHTIDLPVPMAVPAGTTLSVAVKLTTPGASYPVAVEAAFAGYSDQATASAGQGYLSSNGTSWTDMGSAFNASVCLKAFVDVVTETDAPATSLSSAPASITVGWNRSSVTVSLVASDVGSGVYATYYRLNSGATTRYTAPVAVSSQGTNTLQYWSIDGVGNTEPAHSVTFKIDSIAPHTTVHTSPSPNADGWNAGPVEVSLSAADGGSGVAVTNYQLGDASASSEATSHVITAPGVTRLRFSSVDEAGNVEATGTADIKVDVEPPQLSLDATAAYVNVATVRASALDALSGVGRVEMSVDGTSSWVVGSQISAKGEGTHTVYARVVDRAGHSAETSATFSLRIVPVTYETDSKISGVAKAKVRRKLRLSGIVSSAPSVGRVTVVRYRQVKGKWRRAGSATVAVSAGRYAYTFKPAHRGKWRFVARYSGGAFEYITYTPSRSSFVYTKVR
jgi:C1A family cysteine protease